MGKVPFHFPEIEIEFMKGFAKEIGEKARVLREQYMKPENVLKFSHGNTWESPANELGDKVGKLKEHRTGTELSLVDIANGRAEAVFETVSQVTGDMHSQIESMIIETIVRSTNESGQVIDGTQKTFPESMYDMVEMLELPLDEKGELSMPSMLILPSQSPKLHAQIASAGPEFEQRFSMLKDRKKKEAQESESKRLSRFQRPQT